MNKQTTITIILALLLTTITSAIQIPAPTGTVNDFAQMIDTTSKTNIEQLINKINQNTTVEIAVITIESLQGIPKEDYALQIAQTWGIGKKQNDNGILILIAKQEREYRIEIGKGLEGTINDAKAGRIGRQTLIPNFQKNQYGKGIYEAILEIQGLLENDPTVIARYDENQDQFGILIIPYFIITIAITMISFAGKKIKWPILLGWNITTLIISIFSTLFLTTLTIIIFSLIFGLTSRFGKQSIGGMGGFTGRGLGGGLSGGFGLGGNNNSGGFGDFGGGSFQGGGVGGKW